MKTLEQYLAEETTNFDDAPPRRLSDMAYERLRDAIRHTGTPGQPLSETRISKVLGISRTPVREALQQLAQEGLVHVIPGRAVTVAEPSVREVLDIVHTRLLIEPKLMRLIAENISADHLAKLQSITARMHKAVETSDQIAWSEADSDFHEMVALASPNKILGELALQMRNRVHHQSSIDLKMNPDRLLACTVEHQDIVDMIAAGDGDRAEAVTESHLNKLRHSLFDRLGYHSGM